MDCGRRLELFTGPLPGASTTFNNVCTQTRTGRAWLQGGDSSSSFRVELYGGGSGPPLCVPWAGGVGGYALLCSQGFMLPSDCTKVVIQNQGGPANAPLCLVVETS